MKFDEFMGQVQNRARLVWGEALNATKATLTVLGQRLQEARQRILPHSCLPDSRVPAQRGLPGELWRKSSSGALANWKRLISLSPYTTPAPSSRCCEMPSHRASTRTYGPTDEYKPFEGQAEGEMA